MTINTNHSLRQDKIIPHSPTKGMVTEKSSEEAGYTENCSNDNKTTNTYKDSQNVNNSKYK